MLFRSHRVITGNPLHWIPDEPTLSTYGDVLRLSGFGRWLLNSTVVAVVATLAALWVQSMAAYAFARKRSKRSWGRLCPTRIRHVRSCRADRP